LNQREKPKIDLSAVKKILLIRLRRIGDIVMTTPAVTTLKENLPGASLSYVVEEPYRELVEGNPHLEKVIVLPKKQAAKDFFGLLKKLRQERFDILIDFHGGPRATWMTLLARAGKKIGYRIKNKGFIYDTAIARGPDKGFIHSVENHLNLVKALGIKTDSIPPLLIPEATAEEKDRISDLFRSQGLSGTRIVVHHIGAGNRFRDWGVANIVALTNLLGTKPDMRIVLVGAKEDRVRAEEIIKKSTASPFSLAGNLGLRELKELISRAVLFVGPDSGPMHIAASTETSIVAYFGPTLPDHFSPWKAEATIVEKEFACRETCRQRECLYEDFRCLQTITAEEVYHACLNFL
jgi:lipopolysaccharide heptosyltransferase II